ncbi:MAG: InlB B-repeat-containing protein [Ruminiclostridium sp.]|nr:InlB B-repeat-containing protein [Ruminiclostridium sp.]
MKLKKLLSILLTLTVVIGMFAVCAVPASARATAWVTLSSEPSYGGKVSFDGSDWGGYIGKSIWFEEQTVMIYAKAEAGYKFVRWGAPVNSTQSTVKVTGLQDKGSYSITAYFEKIPEPEYNISVRNGTAKDYGSQSNISSSVAGRKIMVTANPAPQSGMVFDKWVVTSGQASLANPSEVTTTFTMPANAVTLEATYKQSDPNAGKKISLYFIQGDKYGQGEYELQVPYGTTFEFPPNPFGKVNGYEFIGWYDADTRREYRPGDKAVATEPTYYAADYKGLPATVSFEIFDNNTASGTMRSVQVERGTYFTLPECTFTPKKGYIFDEWMMYGGAGSKIEVKNDITVWAKFKQDPNYSPHCIITFDNGYKGSKHDTYTEKVLKNSTYILPRCSFTRPETDKKFKNWDMGNVGDTIRIGDVNEMTITAVWGVAGDLSDCTVFIRTHVNGNRIRRRCRHRVVRKRIAHRRRERDSRHQRSHVEQKSTPPCHRCVHPQMRRARARVSVK